MIGTHILSPYRAISVIALIQAGVVVGGTLFVTAMLKVHGYKSGMIPDAAFGGAALFVRYWGFSVLVIPAAWAASSIAAARAGSPQWLIAATLFLGIAIILGAIYCYVDLGFTSPGLVQT